MNVESEVAQDFSKVICNDANYYLIETLRAVQSGFELPDEVSKEEFYYIKNHKDENPALTGFVGFGCAFGGIWFSGYANGNSSCKNYCKVAKRGFLKKMSTMKNVEFLNLDYRQIEIPDGAIVYCDPPYEETCCYSAVGKFDSEEFWNFARQLSQRCTVFVSETKAPDDFVSIWEKDVRRTIQSFDNKSIATEKLFVYSG